MSSNKEKIIAVAEKLESEGVNPTQVTVRQALGGGSFATIGPILKEWKESKKEDHALAEIEVPEAVTERLEQLQGAVWQAAVDEAERRLIAEREALKAAQDAAAAEVAEQLEIVAQLEAEAAEQASRISGMEENENGLSVHIHNLSTELATVKEEKRAAAHTALEAIIKETEQREAAVARAERSEQLHDTEKQQAREDRDAAETQKKAEFADLKNEHTSAINALKKEIKDAQIAATFEVKEAEKAEQAALARAAKSEEGLAALQGRFDAAQTASEKLQERINALELKADQAGQEAAELRGKLQAVQAQSED